MSMNGYTQHSITTFLLEDDLQRDREDYNSEDDVSFNKDYCLFDPPQFEESNQPLLLKNFKLNESKLKEKAIVASKLRQQIVQRAIYADNQDAQIDDGLKVHHMRHIKNLGRAYSRER
jgi:hypothetical protein